jgi:hypothetical protein
MSEDEKVVEHKVYREHTEYRCPKCGELVMMSPGYTWEPPGPMVYGVFYSCWNIVGDCHWESFEPRGATP